MDCVLRDRIGREDLVCPAQENGTVGRPLVTAEGNAGSRFEVKDKVMETQGKDQSVMGSGGCDRLSGFGPVLHFNIHPRVFRDRLLNNAGADN